MKKTFPRGNQLLLVVASACFYSGTAWADGASAYPPTVEDSGFTVLSNSTNVTHTWGLGAAAGI